MTLPRQFLLKGKKWRVSLRKVVDRDDDACNGLCAYDERKILIRKGMSEAETLSTFLHELVHATLHEAHLAPNSGVSVETEEIICDAVADMMTNCFHMKWRRRRG
jgi:Zn-dependent peptidase ImmA (M78 family)